MEKLKETLSGLPVGEVTEALRLGLAERTRAVLQAPPGAGKTTALPLVFLHEPWLKGKKIIMLEPRRIAARAAASRLAFHLNEQAGKSIGFRTRLETKVSPSTRLEVVTEAILTRIIQNDPGLEEYGMAVFDEFHERNIHSDLGLALALDCQKNLREDLRILVMSATIAAGELGRRLDAAVFTSKGRSYPVEIFYSPVPPRELWEKHLVRQTLSGLARHAGSMLVFLPGAGEIKRCAALLEEQMKEKETDIVPLYGDLPPEKQDAAIRPALQGRRKIVLATSIAETSITIDGISMVIDSGLSRVPGYDPGSGFTRLETVMVTRDSAEQRSGRAGRTGPGICIRLWEETAQATLVPFRAPEILTSDLAPLALELAAWGTDDPKELFWINPPPDAALSEARELLKELNALDDKMRITEEGKKLSGFGTHPRLAHMMMKGKERGSGSLACLLAGLLSEQDIFRSGREMKSCEISLRLDALAGKMEHGAHPVDNGAIRRIREQAETWQGLLKLAGEDRTKEDMREAGLLLAFAYPDRIGRQRSDRKRHYLLSNGRGALLAEKDPFLPSEYIVAARLDGKGADARILLASALDGKKLKEHFRHDLKSVSYVLWDGRTESVLAKKELRLFNLVIEEGGHPEPDDGAVRTAMLEGIRKMGAACLPWEKEERSWQKRVMFLRNLGNDDWPDVSDEALLASAEKWLLPFLGGVKKRSDLKKLSLKKALNTMLDHTKQREFERLAPESIRVPSGSNIRIDYSDPNAPSLAVRIQEVFGLARTPLIANGKAALVMHLLSPARRPIQVTRDLENFWKNTYSQVRKELKGEYPKHYWPEDPYQAVPTRRVRPKAGAKAGG